MKKQHSVLKKQEQIGNLLTRKCSSQPSGEIGIAPVIHSQLSPLLHKHMRKARRFVSARLQTALALTERLRDIPSLAVRDHQYCPGSASLQLHVTYGDRVHQRLKISPILQNHGRMSSKLSEWGQAFLDAIAKTGFSDVAPEAKSQIIDEAQAAIAAPLRSIIERPLEVRLRERTAEVVVSDLLLAAEEKGKSGDVAQYLVGAKLALRFNREIPVYPANKSDRTSHFDPAPRLGDFEIENAVIEVAVGLPDDKHLQQIAEIQEKSDAEVWLLTRADRVETWQKEIKKDKGVNTRRVVVTSIEAFIGQNITELGEFSAKGKIERLKALFDLYNTRWVAKVGTPGIRILAK
jgi:hypothetical protein